MKPATVVLDASVGVKWFRPEPGSAEARALLVRHGSGEIVITVDHLFLYEVLSVVHSPRAAVSGRMAYGSLLDARLTWVAPSPKLVAAAFDHADLLGCPLYDAFSAGLAAVLDAPLYSADVKAHAAFPNVVLVGE
ncbi:MAG: hypothetical protein C0418_02425 [Coriobacteriaceae bacterium]|nr:hypothetical protein [Coriobacteriaceae bacterium]